MPPGVRSHWISSLLFRDDAVLLASLGHDLQHVLGEFATEWEAAGMRISSLKIRGHGSRPKKGGLPEGTASASSRGGLSISGFCFTRDGRMEQ